RNAFSQLVKWKNNPERKPLIIRGARQVGKTWLMKEFGQTCCFLQALFPQKCRLLPQSCMGNFPIIAFPPPALFRVPERSRCRHTKFISYRYVMLVSSVPLTSLLIRASFSFSC